MRPQQKLPPDTIALRQLLLAAAISLPVGFVATVAALLWLRHAVDSGPFWSWQLAGWLVHCLEFGIFGALGLCAAVLAVLSGRHYRLGYHRCRFCDRPLAGIGKWCKCQESSKLEGEYKLAAKRPVA